MTADPTGFDRLVLGDPCEPPECDHHWIHKRQPTFPEWLAWTSYCSLCGSHGAPQIRDGWSVVPTTAGDVAVLMVEKETLRRENAALRADLANARRQATDLDARLTRMTHDSAARDRVAPMTAWKDDER